MLKRLKRVENRQSKQQEKSVVRTWGVKGLLSALVVTSLCASLYLTGNAQPMGAPDNRLEPPIPSPAAPFPETPVPSFTKASIPTQAAEAPKVIAAASVKQGEALKVTLTNGDQYAGPVTAELAGRKIRLFPQENGELMGLMPVYVAQPAGKSTLTIKDSHGRTLFQQPVAIQNGGYSRQNITVSSSMSRLKPLPGELETVAALKTTVTPKRFWDGTFTKPTPDCMNSPFGNLRYHNGKFTDEYHKGVDQRSPAGRPVVAIADGKVQISKGYRLHGNTVGLDHGQGMTSIYIHMSKLAVKEGQYVKRGETIGYVGSTGFATGPHLHWGLFVNGLPVNPTQFVKTMNRC